MLLSLTTTHRPATDLGYLLAKHPDRMQSFALGFGQAHVVYPETEERCTASLILDLDPIALVRGRPAAGGSGTSEGGPLANYVNDRPYVASSFLSVAIGKVYGSALNGRTTTKPELVTADLPFSVTLGPIRVRGGMAVIDRLFEPLGYHVEAAPIGPDAPNLWTITLSATIRLQALLSHLYVLIPVLDDDKHYWVSADEIEKLLRHGEGWLAAHPEREFITRRYLRRGAGLARQAMERLAALDTEPVEPLDPAAPSSAPIEEEPTSLNDQRHLAVAQVLRDTGATSVLDLGCGEGKLLRLLIKEKSFTRIVGVDVSMQTLTIARDRLNMDTLPERQRDRLTLLQSALTYRDRRLAGFDAAALVEVIEHVDPERLPAFERAVFADARPGTVILTTPNREWNATIPALADGRFRHRDHRFEWTRAEFAAWSTGVAATHGYTVRRAGIGDPHPVFGHPTQIAIFTCA